MNERNLRLFAINDIERKGLEKEETTETPTNYQWWLKGVPLQLHPGRPKS